jgi:hypothetical protein
MGARIVKRLLFHERKSLPWGWSLTLGPLWVVVFRSPREGLMLGWNNWRSRAVFVR